MKISIVVRSRNDRSRIGRTLQALSIQKIENEVEFVFFDNSSTDGTEEVIRAARPDGIFVSWKDAYVPGKVLNAAVRRCSGDIVVFHNSDCIPLDDCYLQQLVAPIIERRADITFAQQMACTDAYPLVCKDYLRAFGDGSVSATWRHFFSLASSAFRRELLLQEPFREDLQYSEDVELSWRLRQKGFKIVYVPQARVEHSHNYTFHETAVRFYNEGVADRKIFGGTFGFWRGFLLPLGRELLRDVFFLARRGVWGNMPRELGFRVIQRWKYFDGFRKGEFKRG